MFLFTLYRLSQRRILRYIHWHDPQDTHEVYWLMCPTLSFYTMSPLPTIKTSGRMHTKSTQVQSDSKVISHQRSIVWHVLQLAHKIYTEYYCIVCVILLCLLFLFYLCVCEYSTLFKTTLYLGYLL